MKRPPSARKSPPKKRGARKATKQSVQSEKQISAMCTRFRLQGPVLTFRDLRQNLNTKYGVNMSVGTVYRLAHGHEPISPTLRRALGLPVQLPAPVCPSCGVVHVRKTCPAARKPAKLRTAPTRQQMRWLKIMGILWGGVGPTPRKERR